MYQTAVQTAFILLLILSAFRCAAQDFRVNTALGLVLFTESNHADTICFQFGVMAGEIGVRHLGRCAETLPGRVAAAARMADDAGVKYTTFLIESGNDDSPAIQTYFRKCQRIRKQFLSIMPERALLELRQITQNIK